MTEREISALIDIINRAPKSEAEALWCQALLERLLAEAKVKNGQA